MALEPPSLCFMNYIERQERTGSAVSDLAQHGAPRFSHAKGGRFRLSVQKAGIGPKRDHATGLGRSHPQRDTRLPRAAGRRHHHHANVGLRVKEGGNVVGKSASRPTSNVERWPAEVIAGHDPLLERCQSTDGAAAAGVSGQSQETVSRHRYPRDNASQTIDHHCR